MKMMTMIAAASLAALAWAEEPAENPCADKACADKACAAKAKARPPRGGFRNRGMVMNDPLMRAVTRPEFAEKLNLTDEQKAKLGDSAELRATSRALQEKAQKATRRQMELLAAEKIDEAAVMAAIDESFEAKKEFAKEQTKRLIVIRSVLTPEQVKMATELLKGMRADGGVRPGPKGATGDRVPPPPDGPKDAPEDEK